jgi:predicted RNase H-like HicB family nuclease
LPVAPVSTIEIEQEVDGRWLAEVPIVPGALAYGSTRAEAAARAEALAERTLAERIEHGRPAPEVSGLSDTKRITCTRNT